MISEKMIRGVLFVAGGLSLLLGIIGAFLPLLPTVPFVLLTAMCWGRASPRFHAWLLNHQTFGPMVRDWRERMDNDDCFLHRRNTAHQPQTPRLFVGSVFDKWYLFDGSDLDVAPTRCVNSFNEMNS